MNDVGFHDFLRNTFFKMRKGEVAFIKLKEEAHRGIYND